MRDVQIPRIRPPRCRRADLIKLSALHHEVPEHPVPRGGGVWVCAAVHAHVRVFDDPPLPLMGRVRPVEERNVKMLDSAPVRASHTIVHDAAGPVLRPHSCFDRLRKLQKRALICRRGGGDKLDRPEPASRRCSVIRRDSARATAGYGAHGSKKLGLQNIDVYGLEPRNIE